MPKKPTWEQMLADPWAIDRWLNTDPEDTKNYPVDRRYECWVGAGDSAANCKGPHGLTRSALEPYGKRVAPLSGTGWGSG